MIRGVVVVAAIAACGTPGAAPSGPSVRASRPAVSPAASPSRWTWANPRLTSGPLRAAWSADAVAIAVGARGTIVRSTDAGATWSTIASGTSESLETIAGANDSVFAGGAHGTLLRSRDRGVTWRSIKIPATDTVTAVWTDGTTVIASADYTSWVRSTDGGESWTSIRHDYGRATRFRGDGDRVWAMADHNLLVSRDRGATWNVAATIKDDRFQTLWREGSDLVASASSSSSSTVIRSADDGVTWSPPRYLAWDVHDAWGDSLGSVLVASNGALVRTLDHGARYLPRVQYEPTSITHNAIVAARGALLVFSEDGVIRRSVDGGATWSLANAVTEQVVKEVWFDGPHAYAIGTRSYDAQPFALTSDDGGASWRPLADPPERPAPHAPHGEHECTDGHGHRFAIDNYRLDVSNDDGESWDSVEASSYTASPTGIYCAPDGSIYVSLGPIVARSVDHGATWTDHRDNDFGDLQGLAGNGSTIVVAGTKGAFRSTDGGNTYARYDSQPWRAVESRGHEMWLLAGDSVAHSIDGGKTFTRDPLPIDSAERIVPDGNGHALVLAYPTTILRYGPEVPSRVEPGPTAAAQSPLAPAAAARAVRDAHDAKIIDVVTQDLASIAPVLARIHRTGGVPSVEHWLALDTDAARAAKIAHLGTKTCAGVVERYCPARNFTAVLTGDALAWTGRFADGKLYGLDAQVPLGHPIDDDDQRAVATRAFEKLVRGALGAPTQIRRDPSSPDTLELEHAIWLVYGPDLEVGFDVFTAEVYMHLTGKSVALEDALQKKSDAVDQAGWAVVAEKERRTLCTCRHLTVGETFPHTTPGGFNGFDGPRERIIRLKPATCTARVAELDPMTQKVVRETDKKCSDFGIDRGCPNCGAR